MAKKQGKETKVSPFWKPKEPGDKIAGVFVCFQPTKMPDGDTGMAIELDNHKLVPVSWVVKHTLREMKANEKRSLKKGDKLLFEYVGKGGRAKIVEITLNGKLLPRPSAFSPAAESEVNAFLDAPDKEGKGKK